jgi:hypothetical protein
VLQHDVHVFELTVLLVVRQILDEHRKNCERQGKYVEAEIAKNRLDELRKQYAFGSLLFCIGFWCSCSCP